MPDNAESVRLRNLGDQQYEVSVDGGIIGKVWTVRVSSDRYWYGESSLRGRGRTVWQADLAPEGEYSTRKEAVAEMLATWRRRMHNDAEASP